MFLPRCAFWLSVVYASMYWGGGASRHHGSFDQAAANSASVSAIAGAARTWNGIAEHAATSVCRSGAGECLKDAARLTELVETALRSDP